MYVLLLILCILAVLVTIIFLETAKISFFLDTDKSDMHVLIRWIPFALIEVCVINYRPFFTLRLFDKRVYGGFKKKSGKHEGRTELFRALALSDTRIEVACGFSDPAVTGILCAAVQFAGMLIKSADIDLDLKPDFIPESEYLRLKAATELNIGKTLVNLIKIKTDNARRRKSYGSAKFE